LPIHANYMYDSCMAKTQKAKSGQVRNDSRKSGKADKKHAGSRGSRGLLLTEGQKVMLGGGMLAKWDRFNHDEALRMKARDRKKPKTD
jgi:hypothetical protein